MPPLPRLAAAPILAPDGGATGQAHARPSASQLEPLTHTRPCLAHGVPSLQTAMPGLRAIGTTGSRAGRRGSRVSPHRISSRRVMHGAFPLRVRGGCGRDAPERACHSSQPRELRRARRRSTSATGAASSLLLPRLPIRRRGDCEGRAMCAACARGSGPRSDARAAHARPERGAPRSTRRAKQRAKARKGQRGSREGRGSASSPLRPSAHPKTPLWRTHAAVPCAWLRLARAAAMDAAAELLLMSVLTSCRISYAHAQGPRMLHSGCMNTAQTRCDVRTLREPAAALPCVPRAGSVGSAGLASWPPRLTEQGRGTLGRAMCPRLDSYSCSSSSVSGGVAERGLRASPAVDAGRVALACFDSIAGARKCVLVTHRRPHGAHARASACRVSGGHSASMLLRVRSPRPTREREALRHGLATPALWRQRELDGTCAPL
jgi:hypothetical protein